MNAAISVQGHEPPAKSKREPGRLRTSRLVRFYPDELKQVAKAALRQGVSLSRYIAEAALARAQRDLRK